MNDLDVNRSGVAILEESDFRSDNRTQNYAGFPLVDADTFVTAWQKGKSVKSVARQLGLSPAAIRERVGTMRAKGIPLKHMTAGFDFCYSKEEVARLKKLALSLL